MRQKIVICVTEEHNISHPEEYDETDCDGAVQQLFMILSAFAEVDDHDADAVDCVINDKSEQYPCRK